MQYHPYTKEEQEVVMQTEKELMAAKKSGKVLPASVGGAAQARPPAPPPPHLHPFPLSLSKDSDLSPMLTLTFTFPPSCTWQALHAGAKGVGGAVATGVGGAAWMAGGLLNPVGVGLSAVGGGVSVSAKKGLAGFGSISFINLGFGSPTSELTEPLLQPLKHAEEGS